MFKWLIHLPIPQGMLREKSVVWESTKLLTRLIHGLLIQYLAANHHNNLLFGKMRFLHSFC